MDTGATQEVVQGVIAASEDYAAIDYGIRSIDVSRNAFGASACHAAQIVAGCQAARRVTGEFVAQDGMTRRALIAAKKVALDVKRAAVAEQKSAGNARQIRLALAA